MMLKLGGAAGLHLRNPLDDISSAIAAHDVPVNGNNDDENRDAKDERGLAKARRFNKPINWPKYGG